MTDKKKYNIKVYCAFEEFGEFYFFIGDGNLYKGNKKNKGNNDGGALVIINKIILNTDKSLKVNKKVAIPTSYCFFTLSSAVKAMIISIFK